MVKKRLVSLVVLCLFLLSCAKVGVVQPETTKQKLAYAWVTLQGIYTTTESLFDKKLITKDFAKDVVHKGLFIESVLASAETYLDAGDEEKTLTLYLQINSLLIALNNQLLEKQLKKEVPE